MRGYGEAYVHYGTGAKVMIEPVNVVGRKEKVKVWESILHSFFIPRLIASTESVRNKYADMLNFQL